MLSTVCAKFAHQTHAGAKIMASPSRVFLAMGAIAPSNWRICLIITQFSFHLCLTGKFFYSIREWCNPKPSMLFEL